MATFVRQGRMMCVAGLLALTMTALGQQATTYQMNPQHNGESIWPIPPKLPLTKKWDIELPNKLSYPIIADGRIFVLSSSIKDFYGTILHAIDQSDGHELWRKKIPGTYFIAGLTYGDGRLYVINFNGFLQALNPADGTRIWSRQLKTQYVFNSPPTFANGIVYVSGAGSGGAVHALSASTGKKLWITPAAYGDHSSPTVMDDNVFVSYAGNQAYRFNAYTGAELWHHDTGVAGGGGKTTVATDYGLYIRDFYDGDKLLSWQSGHVLSTFASSTIPAASGKLRFDVNEGKIKCYDQTSNTLVWSYKGEQDFISAPIVVNSYVIAGTANGDIYFLKKFAGGLAWKTNVGHTISAPDEGNAWLLNGFAAGEGLIVFPVENHLVAYGN